MTGLAWHERFAWYEAGIGAGFAPAGGLVQPYEAVDAPAPKARLRSLLDVVGLTDSLSLLPVEAASEDSLTSVHDPDYLARLRQLEADGHGESGRWAPTGPDVYLTSRLAVGACYAAVDAVLTGAVDNSYALVRPPGHHARRGEGLGSCVLANAALAVHHARREHGVERVAIIDWDVHHGNGAQEAFWDDPAVLTVSVHQEGYFPPGGGDLSERGGEGALGANLNVPLPPGSGHGAYLTLTEEVLLPLVRDHRPDLVILCSGYDSSAMDPMGRMLLHSDSYRRLTEHFKSLAEDLCAGRLVVVQEGGYSPAYTPFCGLAVFEALAGADPAEDPFLDVFQTMPGQSLTAEQRRYIRRRRRRDHRGLSPARRGRRHRSGLCTKYVDEALHRRATRLPVDRPPGRGGAARFAGGSRCVLVHHRFAVATGIATPAGRHFSGRTFRRHAAGGVGADRPFDQDLMDARGSACALFPRLPLFSPFPSVTLVALRPLGPVAPLAPAAPAGPVWPYARVLSRRLGEGTGNRERRKIADGRSGAFKILIFAVGDRSGAGGTRGGGRRHLPDRRR